MNGKHLVITGFSGGSGKTYLSKKVLDIVGNDLYKISISYTTRKPREGEKDGVDYFFISEEEFKQKIEKDFFLEWNSPADGLFYGTPKIDLKSEDKYILDLDCFGAMNLINLLEKKDRKIIYIVALLPSKQTRKKWLTKRNPEICSNIVSKRLKYAESVESPFFKKHHKYFDLVIENYGDSDDSSFLANKIANSIRF